jgi:hypothetical protein
MTTVLPRRLRGPRLLCLAVFAVPILLQFQCPGTGGGGNPPPPPPPEPPPPNVAPTIVILEPSVPLIVDQGELVNIAWADEDPDDNATIRVFFDTDGVADTGDETTIVITSEDPDGAGDQAVWNTSSAPEGTFFVGVEADDGVNAPVVDYALAAPVTIIVNDRPVITLTAPATDVIALEGANVIISWVANDPDSPDASITIFREDESFVQTTIATFTEATDPGTTTFVVDGSIPPGTYRIGGTIDDGENPSVTSYAHGTVTVLLQESFEQDIQDLGVTFDGAQFNGFSFQGFAGTKMVGGMDVSGDGVDDFVIVAPTADVFYQANPDAGEAYLILGQNGTRFQGTMNLNSVSVLVDGVIFGGADPEPGVNTPSPSTEGLQGVAMIPDRDGDGAAELVFGCPLVERWHSTEDYDPLDTDSCDTTNCAPNCVDVGGVTRHMYLDGIVPELSDGDQNQECPVDGPEPNSGAVVFVSSLTGLTDKLIDLGYVGEITDGSSLYCGQRPETDFAEGLRLWPVAGDDSTRFGTDIAYAQVNGIGTAEVLVSAPSDLSGAGAITVWLLGAPWDNDPSTVNCLPTPGAVAPCSRRFVNAVHYTISGDASGDAPLGHLGRPRRVGDFNADGLEDITCGAPGALANAGIAYMVFGRRPFGDLNVGEIDNPGLPAQPGIELEGTVAGDQVGIAQDAAGDFNGDGTPDWLIGAPGRDGGRGLAAVIFGNPDPLTQPSGSYNVSQLGSSALPSVVFLGAGADDAAGRYVAAAGDFNGDGIDDILVSAPGADFDGRAAAGKVYLIFGRNDFDSVNGESLSLADVGTGDLLGRIFIGPRAGEGIGTVASAGDVDDDGLDDILIGNVNADPLGRTNAGEVYLIYGQPSLQP